jgi:hypothetical protein
MMCLSDVLLPSKAYGTPADHATRDSPMSSEPAITPSTVSPSFVSNKCGFFSEIHLWPREARLNPEAWLSNFSSAENEHAVHLLNAFIYYSAELTIELFKSAFQGLSSRVIELDGPYVQAQATWLQFRRSAIVTRVTGEVPNDTDSGYMFARMARQQLGLDERQIMSNENALETLLREGPRPVVFVDDFVGSGDQFISTWLREYEPTGGATASFQRLSEVRGGFFCYCPVFVAETGRDAIRRECPSVLLSPAHFLPANYSALSDNSIIWPDHLRHSAFDFLETASIRAGIDHSDWMGYRDQGLTLAFEHGVPDATMPIFYHGENGWKPLIRRT